MAKDQQSIYVLVASCNAMAGGSLRLLLEDAQTVVNVCLSLRECETNVQKAKPDVLVIDAPYGSSITSGLELAGKIRLKSPSTSILILSTREVKANSIAEQLLLESVCFKRKDHLSGQELPLVVHRLAIAAKGYQNLRRSSWKPISLKSDNDHERRPTLPAKKP
ncbi:MAG TPA: hypothetical protein VFU48_12715 [Nitrospira sp.]|nr:hypothetical protein [Nitrospira sp.]